MDEQELRDMLIEYMGKGFLDNIIDMFKHDPDLFRFIPDMLISDNMRVRIGTIALIEELKDLFIDRIGRLIPQLKELLKREEDFSGWEQGLAPSTPDITLRGDIAYLLSRINTPQALDVLKGLCNDENTTIREIAEEALKQNC